MQMCYPLLHTPTHTHTQQPHTQPQAHSEADKSNALGIVNHNQNNRTNEANVAHINNNGNNNAMRGSVCVCKVKCVEAEWKWSSVRICGWQCRQCRLGCKFKTQQRITLMWGKNENTEI